MSACFPLTLRCFQSISIYYSRYHAKNRTKLQRREENRSHRHQSIRRERLVRGSARPTHSFTLRKIVGTFHLKLYRKRRRRVERGRQNARSDIRKLGQLTQMRFSYPPTFCHLFAPAFHLGYVEIRRLQSRGHAWTSSSPFSLVWPNLRRRRFF